MRTFRTLALGAVASLSLLIPSSVAAATPVQDGCPAAGARVSVAYLESLGDYQVPRRIDDPANGGNGDGYVCAFALPAAVAIAWGADVPTIYMFFENDKGPGGHS